MASMHPFKLRPYHNQDYNFKVLSEKYNFYSVCVINHLLSDCSWLYISTFYAYRTKYFSAKSDTNFVLRIVQC